MNSLLSKSQTFLTRNSATILTCVGAAGVIATTVTAVKATPKALLLLEKAKEEKGEELTKLEVVKVAGKLQTGTANIVNRDANLIKIGCFKQREEVKFLHQ